MLKEIAIEYFKEFSKKNLESLEHLLSEDVILEDWSTNAHGKAEDLDVNRKLFESVKNINIQTVEMFEDKNTIIAELQIEIDGGEKLNIVDIIRFDLERKIKSIRAYKG